MSTVNRNAVSLGVIVLVFVAGRSPAREDAGAEPVKGDAAASAGFQDLRPAFKRFGLDRRAQGDRDTCSVFTMTSAMEYALARQGRPGQRLSIEFSNWASNQVTGQAEDGACFSDFWRGFEKYGACAEADMPYAAEFDPALAPSPKVLDRARPLRDAGLRMHWIKRWDPTKGLTNGQFDGIKQVIGKGWPVSGGFLWHKKGLERWNDGVLAMVPREKVRDGHSVLLVGFRDDPAQSGGGVFLIRNSSRGPANAALSYEYVRTYMNDAVWIEPGRKPRSRFDRN